MKIEMKYLSSEAFLQVAGGTRAGTADVIQPLPMAAQVAPGAQLMGGKPFLARLQANPAILAPRALPPAVPVPPGPAQQPAAATRERSTPRCK